MIIALCLVIALSIYNLYTGHKLIKELRSLRLTTDCNLDILVANILRSRKQINTAINHQITNVVLKSHKELSDSIADSRNVTYYLYRKALFDDLVECRQVILSALKEEKYESLDACCAQYESCREELKRVFDIDIPESAKQVVESNR